MATTRRGEGTRRQPEDVKPVDEVPPDETSVTLATERFFVTRGASYRRRGGVDSPRFS